MFRYNRLPLGNVPKSKNSDRDKFSKTGRQSEVFYKWLFKNNTKTKTGAKFRDYSIGTWVIFKIFINNKFFWTPGINEK